MTEYTLRAETGEFLLTGGGSRGVLSSGWTGRRIDVEAGYGAAGEWLEHCEATHRPHPAHEARFTTDLVARGARNLDAPLFRGRHFSTNVTPSAEEFGPPPASVTGIGRYNAPGSPRLYLSSSITGVIGELSPAPDGTHLWVQRFRPPQSLQLLDAGEFAENSFAAAAFWRVESRRDREQGYARLGERIATLVATRFDGMIVPGVRSTEGAYFNVILFTAEHLWHDLLDRTLAPQRAA
ncbi:MAG: RES family NAD+ phosphorylase [Gemmatimonadetes bacterium]|nr:RES family NAD+ phosphorylase [Gemmatimonadota bacterium]